jgi:hypothetical protein
MSSCFKGFEIRQGRSKQDGPPASGNPLCLYLNIKLLKVSVFLHYTSMESIKVGENIRCPAIQGVGIRKGVSNTLKGSTTREQNENNFEKRVQSQRSRALCFSRTCRPANSGGRDPRAHTAALAWTAWRTSFR